MKAAFKLPSAAFLMQIYEIFLFSASFWAFSLRFQRKNVNLQKNVERFNVKVMAATVLNSTQVHLLQMFQVDDSQKGLEELKKLLYSYYSKKMDESLNELWDSGVLDQKRLDEINNMDLHKLERITKEQYEFALNRIDELLPLITDETPANDRNAIELTLMSDIVESYEKKHFSIGKPSVSELIELSLNEKKMTQKQLASEIGVSPSRINDYVTGRSEPTLKIARLLCKVLNITPAAMLQC